MVDDFLFICDDAYNRPEFVKMEKDILRTVDFSLGMPISYRFLRRFAKVCARDFFPRATRTGGSPGQQ